MYKPPFVNDALGTAVQYYYNTSNTQTSYNVITAIRSGSLTSVKTPGFRSLKKPYPNNPFNYSVSIENRDPGEWGAFWAGWGRYQGMKGDVYGFITSINGAGSWPATLLHDCPIKARRSVLDKLKNQKFNAAQAFAERKQTANLLITSVNRLASAALAVRKGKMNHAFELFGVKPRSKLKDLRPSDQNLSKYWLEYSYGWRPLVQDIYGAAEVLADSFLRNRPTTVRGTSSQEERVSVYGKIYKDQTAYSREVITGLSSARATYVLEYIMDSTALQSASSLGLTNPAALAWELVPYSFVVDWVVPIGPWLSSLDACNGLSFRSGTYSQVTEDSFKSTWVVSGASGTMASVVGAGRRLYRKTKSRSVLTEFPGAPLPSFDPYLGARRLTSGIALLTQAFSGMRK